MTDTAFENLTISDRHHNPASDRELPIHRMHSEPHLVSSPPGIQVEGVFWNDNAYQEEDDDDQPLSVPHFGNSNYNTTMADHSPSPPPPPPHQQQQGAPRPVSVRNQAAVQINSMRPSRFIKADHQQAHPAAESVPPEMQSVQHLYELFLAKTYMEGYLYRKNESKRADQEAWIRSYVELSGPVLTMWDADQEQGDVLPHYLNVSDATAELNEQGIISLKAGGVNKHLFEVDQGDDRIVLDQWIRAIRLSSFEGSRIHEIYTKKIIMRHKNAGEDGHDDEDLLAKPIPKMEGFLQVRLGGGNEWQKYWVVVSDRRDSRKLFGKKSVPSRGQLMFYESKKAKQPIKTLTGVTQAYTIYPETPQLIDMATLLKADGMVGANEDGEGGQPESVLMMTTSTRELVQWLVGVFDAFKLYGRPSQLLRDPTNPNSLNFGENVPGSRLFLEVEDLGPMDVHEETMAKNRVTMTNTMFNKFKHPGAAAAGQPPMMTGQGSGSGMGTKTNSMPQIAQMQNRPSGPQHPRQRTASADPESMYGAPPPRGSIHPMGQQQQPMFATQQRPPQRGSAMPPRTQTGKIIYASDDSEDEEDEVDDSEDDDDDSVFGDNKPRRPNNASLPGPTGSASPPAVSGGSEAHTNSDRESRASYHSGRHSDKAPEVADPKKSSRLKVNPSPSLSGSDDESEQDNVDESDISDGEYTPHQPKSRFAHQSHMTNNASSSRINAAIPPQAGEVPTYDMDQQQQMMDMYGYHGYQQQHYPAVDEDGPIIPQLGEDFANPNSLLGSVRNDHGVSVRDQAEHAKATGQPLIQVAQKQTEPRAGLVGMISQIEHEKKDHKNRRLEIEQERMMERERFMMQQQQQQQAMMGNPMMGMMDPRMTMMQQNMMMGGMMMPMMDPRMSMMSPNMMMMPMMDPRMSMMSPNMMAGNSAAGGQGAMAGGNQHAPMMMPPNTMAGGNQHASMMMPPNTMAGGNQHASMMMPPMMDPRMSMMSPNMMMYGMWNNGYNNSSPQFGINEEDDEDDDLPLGATNPTKSTSTNNRTKK